MENFIEQHRDNIRLAYCTLDRIVCHGVIQSLQTGAAVVAFFRQERGVQRVDRQLFASVARHVRDHIEGWARRHRIAMVEPPPDQRRSDWLAPYFQRLARRRSGPPVAVIVKARESSRIAVASQSAGQPHIDLKRRFVYHYTVYVDDPDPGRGFIRLCPYFPFNIRLNFNAHWWIARQLRREGIWFRQSRNAFLACSNPERLQQLAYRFSHWPLVYAARRWFPLLVPFFSGSQRRRYEHRLFLSQVEYAANIVFRSRYPAEELFNRLLDLNRQIGRPENLSIIFQKRMHPATAAHARTRISHPYDGNPALRAIYKTNFLKLYLRDDRLLRPELVANNPHDFGVNKGVENLTLLRRRLHDCLGRFVDLQQDVLDTYLDGGQLRQLAQPTVSPSGRRTPGLRLDDPRLLALMQALVCLRHLAANGQFTTSQIHADVAKALGRTTDSYKLSQLRYDLSKLRAKGLVQKIPRSHRYQLTAQGYRLCVLFLKLFQKLYAPLTAAALKPQRPEPQPHCDVPAPSRPCTEAKRARCQASPRSARTTPRKAQRRTADHPSPQPDNLSALDRLYRAVDRALDQLIDHLGIRRAA